MPNKPKPRLSFNTIIFWFALLSALGTLANVFFVVYEVQKKYIVDRAKDFNKAYSEKIASGIDVFIKANMARLSFSASEISKNIDHPSFIQETVSRLEQQDEDFNSTLVANAYGVITQASPETLSIKDKILQDLTPIETKLPTVSDVFSSVAGHLIIFISHPIFSDTGVYQGLIGGTVRLYENNTLQNLVNGYTRKDGAYMFIIDRLGRILYHPDPNLIGSINPDNKAVAAALKGDDEFFSDPENESGLLSSYAISQKNGWRIIVQQPTKMVDQELHLLMEKIALGIMPIAVLGILLIWCVGVLISKPLTQLAQYARSLDTFESYKLIKSVPARFVEIWLIRSALLFSSSKLNEKIQELHRQVGVDALTGLANRRAMQQQIDIWKDECKSFSVISIDIDHFKRVNDTYGHAAGDITLQFLAKILLQNCRAEDLACRAGGEEFILLTPTTSLKVASVIAERLRKTIETTPVGIVGSITISAGIAIWMPDGPSVDNVFELADKLLYEAKQNGRNRVITQSE